MKVLLASSLERGGPVEQTVELARALRAQDVDVKVTTGTEPIAQRLRALGIEAVCLPFRSTLDLPAASRLWRHARGVDVIHAQDRRTGLWVRIGPRPSARGVRVYTVHGLPDEFLPPPVGGPRGLKAVLAYRGVDAALCRRADAVVTPSQAVGDVLARELGFPRERLVVIPNGVSVPDRPLSGGELVGTVATLEPVKGLDVLVEAAGKVAADRPGVRWAVYGSGSDRARLQELAHTRGLDDRMSFPGAVDKTQALATLRLFVLTSYMENCPMAMLEAMAAGIPVVATEVGGVPEVARGVAELVPPGDPTALAEAITRLLDEPDRAASLAAAARERVVERYSAEANVQATLALYRRLLSARS